MTEWTCRICGERHADLPTCFGVDAPWRALVPEVEFESRVELTADQCVVDGKDFFVRGHVEIPIWEHSEPLAFSVWSSLSEESFCDMTYHWTDPERSDLPPYFGWLCTPISVFPETMHLALGVQCREPGLTPLFSVSDTDHPLATAQRSGISQRQWHELVRELIA